MYPPPSVEEAIPTVSHIVAGEKHGGGGGAGGGGGVGTAVVHTRFMLAVLSSSARAVVHVGSTSHGGMHDTTRQTIRPMQAICWLHCP
jgi:hypothetical protein